MEIKDSQNARNILSLNKEKLGILKEVLDVSLKIKDETESGGEDAPDNIASLADKREELVEKIKNIDLAVRHYSSELRGHNPVMFDELQKNGLSETLSDIRSVLNGIKAADEMNFEKIPHLMENLREKIKAAKENRTLMDKFLGGGEISSSGTLLSEKK